MGIVFNGLVRVVGNAKIFETAGFVFVACGVFLQIPELSGVSGIALREIKFFLLSLSIIFLIYLLIVSSKFLSNKIIGIVNNAKADNGRPLSETEAKKYIAKILTVIYVIFLLIVLIVINLLTYLVSNYLAEFIFFIATYFYYLLVFNFSIFGKGIRLAALLSLFIPLALYVFLFFGHILH
jgi:hypothetical protein